MLGKNNKEKEKKLSLFFPKNFLSDIDEIPFEEQEKVIYLYLNFYKSLQKNQIESDIIVGNQDGNQIHLPSFPKSNDDYLYSFNRTIQDFSSNYKEEKINLINSGNVLSSVNSYNIQNTSGYRTNQTNFINIKNVNIINCNDSSMFNKDINKLLLFDQININNELKNNYINLYMQQNKIINFTGENENNNKNTKYQNYNKNINDNMDNNFIIEEKELNTSNNINQLNKIIFEKSNINGQKEFLEYLNNLKVPLTKFLVTKKGICEMENYINMNRNTNINILIQLLNKDGLSKLMKNKFGNYFIQYMINLANYDQIKLILTLISDNFVEISENISGTYVIQTLLGKINCKELRFLVIKLIEFRELEMAFNNNATYVLQKIIEKVPDIERLNLNEIILNNTQFLSINPDCIFIVEKFIDTITIPQNKIRMKNILYIYCLQLCNNPYGNYIIQYILKVWKNDNIQNIQNIIIENANYLVQQRYASNVIEKCFEIFDSKEVNRLVRNICLCGDILNVIKNQYGHYVLNKTIKYIDEEAKIEIEKILNNQMPEMSKKEKSKSKKFISLLKNNQFKKKENNKK